MPKGFAKMPKSKVSAAGKKGGRVGKRGPDKTPRKRKEYDFREFFRVESEAEFDEFNKGFGKSRWYDRLIDRFRRSNG